MLLHTVSGGASYYMKKISFFDVTGQHIMLVGIGSVTVQRKGI